MDTVIRKLQQVSPLASDEKAALEATFSTVRHVGPGEDLISYGDRPQFVGALLQGLLCRYRTLSSGARQIVAFVLPGDVFDLHSFTLAAVDHSVGAITRATVATAPHSSVSGLSKTQPRLQALFWREAVVEAAILREWVVNCGQRSAYARMSHLFCELYARFEQVGQARDGGASLPLTQATLSDATGLSVVHVNRVLQQLRAEGLITLKSGRLVIHDFGALAAAAEFDPAYLHMREPLDGRGEPGFMRLEEGECRPVATLPGT